MLDSDGEFSFVIIILIVILSIKTVFSSGEVSKIKCTDGFIWEKQPENKFWTKGGVCKGED